MLTSRWRLWLWFWSWWGGIWDMHIEGCSPLHSARNKETKMASVCPAYSTGVLGTQVGRGSFPELLVLS